MAEIADSLAVADRIVARVESGVPPGREIHAGETMDLIRAYVFMRSIAGHLAAHDPDGAPMLPLSEAG